MSVLDKLKKVAKKISKEFCSPRVLKTVPSRRPYTAGIRALRM